MRPGHRTGESGGSTFAILLHGVLYKCLVRFVLNGAADESETVCNTNITIMLLGISSTYTIDFLSCRLNGWNYNKLLC